MTVAIGVICENQAIRPDLPEMPAIFLACDSQTTYAGGVKTVGTQKIEYITFKDGNGILITQSGPDDLWSKVLEIMQQSSSEHSLDSAEIVVQFVQQAMRQVHNHLVELKKGCNVDWTRYFWEDNDLNLLVAFYFDRKPYLYHIDLDKCMMIKVRGRYKAIGRGADLARFLLSEFSLIDPEFQFAFPISLSVIEKTIDNTDGCARPIWSASVFPIMGFYLPYYRDMGQREPQSLVGLNDKEIVDLTIEELKSAEKIASANRKGELFKIYETATEKYLTKTGIKPAASSSSSSSPSSNPAEEEC